MAHVRREIDSFLAGIRQDVLTALLAPGKLVWRLLRRRRERIAYRQSMIVLTRQRDLVAWIIPKNVLSLVFSTLGVV